MEDNSPYQASRVLPAARALDHRDQVPHSITSPIRHLWIVLTLLGCFAVFGAASALAVEQTVNAWFLVPILMITSIYFLAAFGVYKRSRVTACLVLLVCAMAALGTVINIATGKGTLTGVGALAVLTFVSVRGTLAVFRYHRHVADARRRPPRARLSDDPAFAPKLDV